MAKKDDKKSTTKKDEKPGLYHGLKGKRLLWLHAYLDESNHATFLNQTGAARAATYPEKSCYQIGYENFRKLEPRILQWLDEHGLSEARLKQKLLNLVSAKQTIMQKVKGNVDRETLPEGVQVIASSHVMKWAGKGEEAEPIDDGDTVISITVESIETQRRALDMALKVRNLYAPVKLEIEDKTPVDPKDRASLKELARAIARKAAKSE